jgi:hypothetical protein
VLQAFTRGGVRWVWLSVLLHFAVNAIGVMAARTVGPYQTEALIAVMGASVLALGVRLSRARRGAPLPTA